MENQSADKQQGYHL